jgi:hypothetical protein
MNERSYPGSGRIIRRDPPVLDYPDSQSRIRHYGHIGLSLIPTSGLLTPQIRWTVDPAVFERGEYPGIEDEIRRFLAGLEGGSSFVVEITDGSYAGDCICDLYPEATIIALKEAVARLQANGR